MDVDSDSSSLSSAPDEEVKKLAPIFLKAKKATKLVAPPPAVSPPRPKRPPSPPHETVLADNGDIAFIVTFRSRFNDAFPGKLPHFGPQDIERGVVDSVPSPQIESLLCALLALVLNRKKPVERGHHGRALEEAIASHKSQWPPKWESQNPIHGGKDFRNMLPTERLDLLRTLIMWALSSSEIIQGMIKEKYKQNRNNDDENQPLSVQPWGSDGDKRRYFLIQGLDDTSFQIYREGSRYTRNWHWWSVAGTIDEVKALAEKLEKEDGSQAARRLGLKMINAIPMFEATEEKRHRREYRQQRRAAFMRPEPGFGIYEGRTRGKRMRYNYDDDDQFLSDDDSTRRSTRQQSGRSTPFESGPTFTASGRQVKQPRQGEYGEKLLGGHGANAPDELSPDYDDEADPTHAGGEDDSEPVRPQGRSTRFGHRPPTATTSGNGASSSRKRKFIDGYNSIDAMSDEDEASADEWDSEQNEGGDEDEVMPDADDEGSDLNQRDDEEEGEEADDEDEDLRGVMESLIVKLKLPHSALLSANYTPPTSPPSLGDDAPKVEPRGEPPYQSSLPPGSTNNVTMATTADLEPAVARTNGATPAHGATRPARESPPPRPNLPSLSSTIPDPPRAAWFSPPQQNQPSSHHALPFSPAKQEPAFPSVVQVFGSAPTAIPPRNADPPPFGQASTHESAPSAPPSWNGHLVPSIAGGPFEHPRSQ